MQVLRAEVLGMCFGVRDALKMIRDYPQPQQAAIHGELVHNQVVLTELTIRGFQQSQESERDTLPESPVIVVTAHGISEKERARLLAAGKQLVDTTCPLVRRVHLAAQKLQREGCHVIVIGKANHVEVRGIVEDLDSYTVIGDESQVSRFDHAKLGIISQSTTAPKVLNSVHDAIRRHNPHAVIRFIDTTCQPTRHHQSSLEQLLPLVEAVVVVGGHTSHNTKELAALARRHGLPAYHVQDVNELDADWFKDIDTVGVTAGTSTLDETIAEVEKWLSEQPGAACPRRERHEQAELLPHLVD